MTTSKVTFTMEFFVSSLIILRQGLFEILYLTTGLPLQQDWTISTESTQAVILKSVCKMESVNVRFLIHIDAFYRFSVEELSQN